MFGVGKKGIWKINKTFLDQKLTAGKTFLLANDPLTDGGFYFAKEVEYLTMKGVCSAFFK